MASTKAPLFGLDASGSLAKSIVFSKWRGRTYVRRHAIPANPKSALQVGMRAVFKFITQDFKNLTQSQKDAWDALAAPDNITQLNAQVKDSQSRARVNEGWRRGPAETPATTPVAPVLDTVTAQDKSLVVSWTPDAVTPGEYTAEVYMRITTALTGLIQELRVVVPIATESLTVIGLPNDIEQFVVVRMSNFDGERSVASNEVSGTPTA